MTRQNTSSTGSHESRAWRSVHFSPKGSNTWDLGGIYVANDVRISIFGPEGLEPGEDVREVRMAQEEDRFANGGMIKAGKEKGILFYFIVHTSFLEGEEYPVAVPDLDKAWKDKK